MHYARLLNQNAKTLFDKDAFNPYAFAEDPSARADPKAEQLGERLFHDTRLSGTMTRSCASCHQPSQLFTDGLPVNTVINGAQKLPRRTPTLINAALQPAQFADMRAVTLEQQVTDVIGSAREMQGDLSVDSARISGDSAYGTKPLSTKNIVCYLAAYVRSLTYLNSRFDQFMRGDHSALTGEEIAGFNLFMGKGRCGTCHYMPLFNGAFPPFFDRMDAEVIGVPGRNGAIDADPGQFGIVPAAPLMHAFKTPTVRNSARFAFYMHNGTFSSLQQVLDFYNKGGGQGQGLAVPNQTLSPTPLHLSKSECAAIIAFIGSLNSQLPGKYLNPRLH
jgi:cytochrome c peroxidase